MDEYNLSTYEVSRRSGNAISNGTVWNILKGRTRDVKEATLKALARALKMDEDDIFAAYHGRVPVAEGDLEDDQEVAALFYKYKGLTEEDKKEIRRLLAIVDREMDRISQQRGEHATHSRPARKRVRA